MEVMRLDRKGGTSGGSDEDGDAVMGKEDDAGTKTAPKHRHLKIQSWRWWGSLKLAIWVLRQSLIW